MARKSKPATAKSVEALRHEEATRKNIPTAEYQPVLVRDRLTVARDRLTESGSIFVHIGDENAHWVQALMDEVLGHESVAHR